MAAAEIFLYIRAEIWVYFYYAVGDRVVYSVDADQNYRPTPPRSHGTKRALQAGAPAGV